ADVSAKHQIKWTWLSEILRPTVRTLAGLEFVSAQARIALATVNQRIIAGVFVSGVFPNQTVQNYGRIKAFDVVTLVKHPALPRLPHIVRELNAERAVIPRTAQTAVDFRGWVDATTPLGEGNNRIN